MSCVQVDIINEKFAEAREEIDYAREDAETVSRSPPGGGGAAEAVFGGTRPRGGGVLRLGKIDYAREDAETVSRAAGGGGGG